MFITTFYSFKGGVGRSMALANVAAQLADSGKRVLVVDFDLEAPGLSTLLPPPNSVPGILEYVESYQSSYVAPDVRDYCYQYDSTERGGELWVMPASGNTGGHADTLAKIDWQTLYARHDGYLMVEDLKEQWRRSLCVDYVFVDSRTGHTDVEGICTRQLPNALVLLFFPNEQNRIGLTEVSNRVARHNKELNDKKSQVTRLYVAANVPDLDDEYEVLASIMGDFRTSLGYEKLDALLHHYPSLRLLEEPLFVRHRKNTKLARQYLDLTKAVQQANPEDEVGVLSILNQVLVEGPGAGFTDERRMNRLLDVPQYHADKPNVLFKLAIWKDRMGDAGEALNMLDSVVQLHAGADTVAEELESEHVEARLRRARLRLSLEEDVETAREDVLYAVQSPSASLSQLVQATKLTQRFELGLLNRFVESPSIPGLEGFERAHLIDHLCISRASTSVALPIAEEFYRDEVGQVYEATARNKLGCMLIALGQFDRALQVLCGGEPPTSNAEIDVLFNYAMASWAKSGEVPQEPLERLVEKAGAPGSSHSINFDQCLAVACWALGKTALGHQYIQSALGRSRDFFRPELSCWSYLHRSGTKMRAELESVRDLLQGANIRPAFMQHDELFDAIESIH